MKIVTKKESFELKEYFKTVKDLKTFIKENNEFVNVEGIGERIGKLYDDLSELDISLKSSVLPERLIYYLGFKNRSAFKLDFWLERGNTITEFNTWLLKRRNIEPVKSLDDGNINKFEYGEFKFTFDGRPVCNLCKSDLTFDVLTDRYVIKNCQNDSCPTHKNQDQYFIRQLAYLPLDIFKNKNKRINIESRIHPYFWLLSGLTYDESLKKCEEIKTTLKNKIKGTDEYYKILFGLTDEMALDRALAPTQIRFWVNRGFSEEEAKIKVSENQKNAAKSVDFDKRLLPSNIEYWIKRGLTEEEAKVEVSNHQRTFTLQKCIDKHGEGTGNLIYTKRQVKWQTSLIENGNLKCGFSRISQELFYRLLDEYSFKEKIDVFFATKNKEYFISLKGGEFYQYDFVDRNKMKIIEFNGDCYHANPIKYNENDKPNPFRQNLTASDIWAKDKRKTEVAIENGFQLLTIWESEYKKNKELTIKKCLDFLEIQE